MKFITVKRMMELEKHSEDNGTSTLELMERAGMMSAEFICRRVKPNSKILIVCGTGNNGGDGFVCARYLAHEFDVSILRAVGSGTAEAIFNFKRISESSVNVLDEWPKEKLDVVVDALLGTGTSGRLREPIASLVRRINDSGAIVVSMDIPTGVDPDTGGITDIAVKPDYTVAFHAPKKGLMNTACGEIAILDIGL
ncbi:MAG: NAD(P)H-hydrate epimerase [Candidatus Micrarchaeota archaeon]